MNAGSKQQPWAFLVNAGEMGSLIAGFDWSATSIGPITAWPAAMRTSLAFVLRSQAPIVTLWGPKGVMIYNDAYRTFAGDRHPGLLGSDVLEGWHEIADFNANVMRQVYHGGGTLSYKDQELTLIRDGTPRRLWTDIEYSPAFDDDGSVLGVIAIVLETTQAVLANERIADERRKLLQMAEHSPSFMALLEGPEHRFLMTNPAYQALVGGREVIGQPIGDVLPEAQEQDFLALLDQVYASGEVFQASGASFQLQGSADNHSHERRLDFVYQPLRNEEGEVTGIFVSGVDVTDRMRAEAAISASEAQFRTFAQALPSHIWTAPPDGKLDWFNDQMFEYSGATEADLTGDGWTSIVHPDDLAEAAERWQSALGLGQRYETEFRIRAADGSYRWHLVRAVPIRDDADEIIRWIGTNTDIHEQKLSQAQSSADRDRLWSISRDLMLVCTFDGVITAVNPSARRLLGWAEDEMVGKQLGNFIHPDDIPSTYAEVEKLSQGVTTLAFENRYRTSNGDYRLLAWTAVPDADRIHAVGRDITDERQLLQDRDRTWSLSPILKVVTDSQGTITDVNPSWTKALGWSRQETLGKRSTDFMTDDESFWSERVRTLSAGQPMLEYQTRLRAKDGHERLIKWTTVPEGGTFYGFGRDVTAETEAAAALADAEAALRQSQKMEAVGQLTGGIAHDFNNLLQGITGSLEIVQRRVTQGRFTELDRYIAGASNAANRAAGLTHRLLAFSRRQPLDPKPVRANTLVSSMDDLLRRTLGERIELELALAGGLWITKCDPNQLESAILNLAINARDAMPEGGKLTIETCNAHLDSAYAARQRGVKPGQYVCICVTDTGVGMDADTIAKAFEPFFTTKPIGQGTGLGLSMIYGFAQQSEGYAKIYSEVAKGTTFKLYLPRFRGMEETDEPVHELTEAHMADAGEVVLVVEDEPIVRGLIVEELKELGYQALEAVDGPNGLEILQSKRRIDLLVTDIGLPGLNGRQVADAARELRPGLKMLFMTGYAENAALASGFLEHGMEMITKPFAMEALATRIRTMIES
ncbi:PAS domain S-box protein [Sphingobium yanoikuyae]|uniref:PAS domain S-box protein n=1 Tax=Sphingobium yanoikuyae TaxID=13690 RepID=UPI0022DD52E5|nr:PAS domain S-box protein [Sphingobium yanoikuyae]WBQ19053.1 PAS domain S-box protein [Sphingobium yanoikuyae]